MDVFNLRGALIEDYQSYVESFVHVADGRIRGKVERLDAGLLWPEPLVQLDAAVKSGGFVDDLVAGGLLHPECAKVFRVGKDDAEVSAAATADHVVSAADTGRPLGPHRHQTDAVRAAAAGANYVLTTGTGSDENLAHLIPIADHVLRHRLGGRLPRLPVGPRGVGGGASAMVPVLLEKAIGRRQRGVGLKWAAWVDEATRKTCFVPI